MDLRSSPFYSASWIELSEKAFINNVETYKKYLGPETRLSCVLKGNAYGHGLEATLPLLHPHVDVICLIATADALFIRQYEEQQGLSPKRILVLGALSPEDVLACSHHNIEAVWPDCAQRAQACLHHLQTHNAKLLTVHLHIETGLSREGYTLQVLTPLLNELAQHKSFIHVQGLLSHFANVEDVTQQDYASEQLKKFSQAYDLVKTHPVFEGRLPERHFAQSAASFILPDSRLDFARVGIGLYGIWPSHETRISTQLTHAPKAQLHPVLSWRCWSQTVKQIPQGAYVGYGCTYRTVQPTHIAVFPVGYFDGYPRLASHRAHVLVQGTRCPVLGRVMMNHIIVDVGSVPHVELAQPLCATLVGQDGQESICLDTLASWCQSISYEVMTRIGSHVKRVAV